MDNNTFYKNVSSWINSYRSVDALIWLEKFIDNSHVTEDIKQKLRADISEKKEQLLAPKQ